SAHLALQAGLDVGQEQHVASTRALGQLRREALEHAELSVERLARVEVPAVLATPEEGLAARHALDVGDVHAAVAHDLQLALAEVLADWADDQDLGEEGGGQREVHGGAAEHPLALAERGLHGVKG